MAFHRENRLRRPKVFDWICPVTFRGIGLLIAAALLSAVSASHAANVSLSASDATGTSSFTGSTNWSLGGVPTATNAYFTGAFTIRTTNTQTSGVTYPFAGGSLSIDAGGRLLGKIGNNVSGNTTTGTISGNFILNGGNFEQAGSGGDHSILTVTGTVTVNAASGIGALGATANGSASFETLDFVAPISGSAALQLSGAVINAGADSGVVRLSAANPYNGTISVSNAVNNIIASTVNRMLQLNSVDAVSNAMLNLTSASASPVSFAASANTRAFKVGALAGQSSQALVDTAGAPVTLSVGGNNSSSDFAGSLTGPGALTKTGSGVLTLSGVNTYSGGTTISNGTLQASYLRGAYSGGGTIVLMSPSAFAPQTVVTGAIPFFGKWIVASGWLASATNGAFGTNSITIDPQFALDPSAGNPLRASVAEFEPNYDLNSAGQLTLTNGGQMILHQNCAFVSVLIDGVALASGTHSYGELATNFPNNFSTNGFGYITVQPFGTLPPPSPQLPQFVTQPVSQTNFSGMAVQFTASAYGYPAPSFQWQCGSGGTYSNLVAGGQFSGTTSSTLTITNLSLANAALYVLVASNSSGTATSTPAMLTVYAGGAVVTNSTGLSISMAQDGTYTVASTTPAWQFKGSLWQSQFGVIEVDGADSIGGYSELRFDYTASAPHSAAIRLYTNQPVVLFSDTSQAAGVNDLAFPHLTNYPANLYHVGYADSTFAPYSFSQLSGDSPWFFFDTNFNSFVISPAANFMIASDTLNADSSISCGINSAISQLPAGFTHRTLLVIKNGINQTYEAWGNALTGLSTKQRPANDSAVELNKLGYWTDNGAAYYYTYSASRGYAGTLLAIRDQFATNHFPLGYLQLDSWWYLKGVANTWQGDATNSRGGVNLYVPDATLFPSGLSAFQQQLGLPLITHCRWIDGASPYRSQYAMSANVIVDPTYWTNRMTYLKVSGVVTFEHDWLDVKALPAMNLNDPPTFMNYMASAAASNGLNMQYCMPLPRHYLQSSLYNNLVTSRVSNDRFEISKWNTFIYNSRLEDAVGAWPWTDVYYSTETRNLLIGTLSAGPVGVGDALGGLNTTNLAKSVRPDGVIVKPDVSLAPIEQTYLNDAEGLNLPMVAATHVDNGNLRALYVFAFARSSSNTNASFAPSQLGVTNTTYVYDYFKSSGSVLAASNVFNFSTTLTDNTNGGTFYVVVPIGPSGIALLGDTNKFVTLGKKRIAALSDTGVLKATVLFATNETNLVLSGYAPSKPYALAFGDSAGAVTYDSAKQLFSLNVMPDASNTATLTLSLSQPPFLQITNLGGSVQILWPAPSTGYLLECATELEPSENWVSCTNSVSVVDGRNIVSVIPSSQAVFYRLKQ